MTEPTTGFLDLSHVQKTFGTFVAVARLRPVRAIGASSSRSSGPSGCGKTTTLRMIAGFRVPGRRLDHARRARTSPDLPPNQRNVGMVFQSYALFPNMTVASNVGFGMRVQEAPEGRDQEARRRAARADPHAGEGRHATRTSCRAASSSGSRWPARSRSSPRSSCSTSRSRRSTPRSGSPCARRSGRSSASSASRRSTSPTTRRRRSRCPIGSSS